MSKRAWISSTQLFWTKDEWQEASEYLARKDQQFGALAASEQVEKMIAYLTKKYPVEQKELQKVK